MFTYNISKVADNKAFHDACAAIESKLNNITQKKLFRDVDGSLIQKYITTSGEIEVFNDYVVDAVYADSELDLSGIL